MPGDRRRGGRCPGFGREAAALPPKRGLAAAGAGAPPGLGGRRTAWRRALRRRACWRRRRADVEGERSDAEHAALEADLEPLTKVMKGDEGVAQGQGGKGGCAFPLERPWVFASSASGWPTSGARTMQAKAKKTMEVNPKHCIASLLRRKAVSDETGATLQEGIWLLFYTSLMESCYTLEEPTQFAGRIRRMVLRGLCTDDADMGFGLDDDRPMMEGLQKKDPQADVVAQSAEGEDPMSLGVSGAAGR